MKSRKTQNGFVRGVKKFLLSAFLVLTFSAYALEKGATAGEAIPTPSGATTIAAGTPAGSAISSARAAPPTASPAAASPDAPAAAPDAPVAQATATSAPTPSPSSAYKDGTYAGPEVDVNWGLVQVQATIQGGKISNVQFLEYPSDRRTSVRINSIANPELQQEAIQAQSANVNIITGATLTSEGFQMSLQAALNQAKG